MTIIVLRPIVDYDAYNPYVVWGVARVVRQLTSLSATDHSTL